MVEVQGLCCAGFFFLIGLFLIYDGTRKFLLMQKIQNTPTSKVRSAAVGLAELFGKVTLKEGFTSPISRAKCAYYSIKCEYWQQRRKSSDWVTFYTDTKLSRFLLEDDTGRMLIEPKEAELNIPADFSWTGHLTDKGFFGLIPQKQLDDKILKYLEENPEVKSRFMSHSGKNFRVTETYLAENDSVYVLGSVSPLEGVQSSVSHENLLVKKDPIEKIMYISDSGEKKVLENVRNTMLIEFAIGFVLSAILLFIILDNLGV
jgi:hypothetical protein